MTLFKVLLMAARYEKARSAGDYEAAVPLEKTMLEAAMLLEKERGVHPYMAIVKGRNAVRKARRQELLNM